MSLTASRAKLGRKGRAEVDEFYDVARKGTGLSRHEYRDSARQFDTAFGSLINGRFREAIDGFNRILKFQPNHVQSHGNLGLAYAGLADRESALRHLNRAIELNPSYEPAIENRRAVQALLPGEKLQFDGIREIDFYADKLRESPRQSRAAAK